MDWLYYLLEANLYLLIFYGFYRLFLHRETFYASNRYYLLLSSITAFILPILQLGFLNPKPQAVDEAIAFPPPVLYTEAELAKMANTSISATIDYTTYLYPIYLFICCFFVLKLILSISKIIHLWLTAKKDRSGKITIVELEKEHSAFSFFNLLFIHPQLAAKQTVLKHEMIHIKQKHSLDILFFEILQIISWFNPAIYFVKKDIKLLHEYIADELTTSTDIQKHEYAMFLIENSFGVIPTPLTNQIFNQSILKRRINMLNKKRTADWARLRLLLALPLGAAMLCTSTMAFTKDYGYIDLLPEKSLSTTTQEVPKVENIKKQTAPKAENVKRDQVKFPPPIIKNDRFTPIYAKDKSTGKPVLRENRLILINEKAVENLATFYGVYDADNVKYSVNESSIAKKYGDKGKNGLVEITGKNIKYYNKITYPAAPPVEPPPPGYQPKKGVKKDQIKFPPPIVKPDNKPIKQDQVKFPPPVVKPQSVESSTKMIEGDPTPLVKQDQIKFPPPIVKQNNKPIKQDQVKFPPPVVKPQSAESPTKIVEGDPTPLIKEDQVKFPPPIVKPKSDKNQATITERNPITQVREDQVKFPPPIVKPDKSNLRKRSNAQTALKKKATTHQRERNIASLTKERNAKINQLVLQREIEVAFKKQIRDKRIEAVKSIN